MINKTFSHIKGIGPKTESKLKELGFYSWNECLKRKDHLPLKAAKKDNFISEINESIEALSAEDLLYFTSKFPQKEQWRILGTYFKNATFFDIETTGLSWYDSHVSVIAAYQNGKMHTFLFEENMDDFLDLVYNSTMLVSFNGKSFDIPFLEQSFHIPSIDCPHVDLRWIAYHMGYEGGLKNIEGILDVKRPEEIGDINGFEAVGLYYRWRDGDISARNSLISYCRADVISTYLVAEKLMKIKGFSPGESNTYSLFNEIWDMGEFPE